MSFIKKIICKHKYIEYFYLPQYIKGGGNFYIVCPECGKTTKRDDFDKNRWFEVKGIEMRRILTRLKPIDFW